MDYKNTILKTAAEYCELSGRARSGVANSIMNDGKFFDRIEQGGGCTMDTYQRVMGWFAENMPAPPDVKDKHRRPKAS